MPIVREDAFHRAPLLLCRKGRRLFTGSNVEEFMRYHSIASAALCLGLVVATSASAAQEPTEALCHNMDSQVRSALQNPQSSANQEQAVRERNSGRQFCQHGLYRVGTEHFAQALKLLGANTQNAGL
jgi:hypothetical protein